MGTTGVDQQVRLCPSLTWLTWRVARRAGSAAPAAPAGLLRRPEEETCSFERGVTSTNRLRFWSRYTAVHRLPFCVVCVYVCGILFSTNASRMYGRLWVCFSFCCTLVSPRLRVICCTEHKVVTYHGNDERVHCTPICSPSLHVSLDCHTPMY